MNVLKKYERSEMDSLISASEAASLYPLISKTSLWRWAREGKIPSAVLPSGRRLFSRKDIEALLTPVISPATSSGSRVKSACSDRGHAVSSAGENELHGMDVPLPGLGEVA